MKKCKNKHCINKYPSIILSLYYENKLMRVKIFFYEKVTFDQDPWRIHFVTTRDKITCLLIRNRCAWCYYRCGMYSFPFYSSSIESVYIVLRVYLFIVLLPELSLPTSTTNQFTDHESVVNTVSSTFQFRSD